MDFDDNDEEEEEEEDEDEDEDEDEGDSEDDVAGLMLLSNSEEAVSLSLEAEEALLEEEEGEFARVGTRFLVSSEPDVDFDSSSILCAFLFLLILPKKNKKGGGLGFRNELKLNWAVLLAGKARWDRGGEECNFK